MNKFLPVTSRLVRDESAVVSILVGATMLLSIAVAGFAVDYGRAEFAKIELQNALDAGALAAARAIPFTQANVQAEALQYFGANWGAPFTSHVVDSSGNQTQPVFTLNAAQTTITSSASISVKTTMLWAIGQKAMLASAAGIVTLPQIGGVELALVLDNTGSEAQGCKMNYIVAAAQGLVNKIYGVPNVMTTHVVQPPSSSSCSSTYQYSIPTSYVPPPEVTAPAGTWISIVPFVTSVAPVAFSTKGGSDMQNWLKNGWLDGSHGLTGASGGEYPPASPWQGCVEARLFTGAGGTDQYEGEDAVPTSVNATVPAWNGANGQMIGVELAPSQAPFSPYFYPSDTDIVSNPLNPAWALANLDVAPGQVNPPAFTTIGAPNAPYWPAFNVWNSSLVGPAGNTTLFNDDVTVANHDKIMHNGILAATVPLNSGNTMYRNDIEFNSSVTAPAKQSGVTYPVFLANIPSNPPAHTYDPGPNLGCPTAMTVMSTDYTQLMTNLAAMYPVMVGGTVTNVGLAWGARVLSPNYQGVWNNGAAALNQFGVPLPLPYSALLTDPSTKKKIAVQKFVVFMTDGNNEWGIINNAVSLGDNTYTAYKTLDHTPLIDQTPAWTNATNIPASKGGVIPAPVKDLTGMAGRADLAVQPPSSFTSSLTGITDNVGGIGLPNSQTAEAWALCQQMQRDGITVFTILLEFGSADISKTTRDGYGKYCASSSSDFFDLQGVAVSTLPDVFQAIGNSINSLRITQ